MRGFRGVKSAYANSDILRRSRSRGAMTKRKEVVVNEKR
jgi:hypothetical protein